MSRFAPLIQYSAGQWRDANQARQANSLPYFNCRDLMQLGQSIVVDYITDRAGVITKYRAYDSAGQSFIDLARFRKSMGITGAPESFDWRKTA